MKKRAIIKISGLVQGIGFRPFIYRIAVKRGLRGYVTNLGDAGVCIEVNGDEEEIKQFLREIIEKKPKQALYTSISVDWLSYSDEYEDFRIIESDVEGKGTSQSFIPPDVSICEDCIKDMLNKDDRRYLYPFTCCATCGPRFTIIKDLPYDRVRTTMNEFPLCPYCEKEFNDPEDRRFNAQTICCPICGPKMFLYDNKGDMIECDEPIRVAAKILEEGKIVAIKGIGGFHLAAKATDDEPVLRLRKLRRKSEKPFAIMSPDVKTIRTYAFVSKIEEEILRSYAKPIVCLRKKIPFPLSEYIAPGLHTIGVMLPYSGIHYLLFHYSKEPAFIMTSANLPQEPTIVTNEESFSKLRNIADYFLVHNREIWARCDDSVVRIVGGDVAFLRRSRGYAPLPIPMSFSKQKIIAVGADLNSTAAVLKEGKCYISQHIGDVENIETLNFLKWSIENLLKLLKLKDVDAVVCDLHPRFLSKKVAIEFSKKFNAPLIEVQHHHSHLASLMAENGVNEKIIGIVCDGAGYGTDGTIWGGEILLADYEDFVRLGSLEPQPMPGGDLCTIWYGRMLQAILYEKIPRDELKDFLEKNCLAGFSKGSKEIEIVFKQLDRRIQTPLTTSMGRILDAASCLLGICYKRTYEGEGAMKLEAVASKGDPYKVDLPLSFEKIDGRRILKTSLIMVELYELCKEGYKKEDLAASFLRTLAEGLAKIAIECAREKGVDKIGFTGGVAYNDIITTYIKAYVEKEGFTFLRQRLVPNGDGGISLGQVAIAAARLKDKE